MARNRMLRQLLIAAATLAAGLLPTSCQVSVRNSFVDATKATFIQALEIALLGPEAADSGS